METTKIKIADYKQGFSDRGDMSIEMSYIQSCPMPVLSFSELCGMPPRPSLHSMKSVYTPFRRDNNCEEVGHTGLGLPVHGYGIIVRFDGLDLFLVGGEGSGGVYSLLPWEVLEPMDIVMFSSLYECDKMIDFINSFRRNNGMSEFGLAEPFIMSHNGTK